MVSDATPDAEAAAWIARLQSPDRSDATETALKTWLLADPANADAFERATEIWTMIPGAALYRENPAPAPAARPSARYRQLALAASILLLVAVGAAWFALTGDPGYSTRVGEQKIATLEDGSRIALNTDTEVEVDYSPGTRRIRLRRGEAIFEVAPDARRPFIVEAGETQIGAIGTKFLVRRGANGVAVTLIEGKVSVRTPRPGRGAAPPATMLVPGERLTANPELPPTIDRPAVEAVTAWRRGQVVFSDVSLASAVAELNRYGGPALTVADPHLASLRVSGVFATHETEEFAAAVAALHGLRVQRAEGQLRIVR